MEVSPRAPTRPLDSENARVYSRCRVGVWKSPGAHTPKTEVVADMKSPQKSRTRGALAHTNGALTPEVRHSNRSQWTGEVRAEALLEAICALHLASYVDGPVKDKGGLMLVGPPGVLKTTFLDVLDNNYHNVMSASNLNTTTLLKLQGQFFNGTMRSIILPDVQAMYAGDPRTAARLEQAIMQLAGEGNRGASWQDARFQKFKSRCAIFGAMTQRHHEQWSNRWEESGFLRRFLWSSISLANPDVLMDAIEQWHRADLGGIRVPDVPGNSMIEDSLTRDERRRIRGWLKYQPGPHEVQLSLMCRATSALRWHYRKHRIKTDAMSTMREFAETLQRDAARIIIGAEWRSRANGNT